MVFLLDYLLVLAFCHYQHVQIEYKLGKLVSMKQLQEARRKKNLYRSLLQKQLTPVAIERCFPGLRQQIEYDRRSRLPVAPSVVITGAAARSMVAVTMAPSHKKAIYTFISSGTAEYSTRLTASLGHYGKTSSKMVIHVKTQDRSSVAHSDHGRCIVCCGSYDKHSDNYHLCCTSRHGRKTTSYCVV